jgi:predicted DNA-binding transcriptional regulator AlpA
MPAENVADAPYPRKGSRVRGLPLMVHRSHVARLCSVSRATWDRWTAAGRTPAPVKIGGACLWSTAELRAWCRHGCPPRSTWDPIWAALRKAR